ncbi:MAG: ATP synthase F1 subunit gamma [Oscillospiraceae bacterium]
MASGNMKAIKRRIKSVESTKQITKAMELVASSKLRKAKEKADNSRPYFNALYETMCEIQAENNSFFSPYTRKGRKGTVLLVVIAGDRGLAGGFNSNVIKLAQKRISEITADGKTNVEILGIGKKSVEYFEKHGFDLLARYVNIGETLKIGSAAGIAEKIVNPYLKGEYERVELFYTDFTSAISQTAMSKAILPVEIREDKSEGIKALPIYEPSAEQVFNSIVPKYLSGIIFCAVVDSFASEQAARRNAMESASDNADEILSELSLKYNRARQASITQELTEIVGGASAQE